MSSPEQDNPERKLSTECPHELFVGFFGIDANGNQPDCGAWIEVETDAYEYDEVSREYRLTFSISCPKCGNVIDPGDVSWSES